MRETLPPNIHTHEHGAGAAPSWYFLTPAYVALPLIRWPLGYDIVAPGWAWGRVGGFFLFPLVGWFLYSAVTNMPPPLSVGHAWLVSYGVVAAIAATIVWGKRARGQYRAEEIHTGEAGYSCVTWWLPAVPVPVCEMLIVPLSFAVLGWLIARTFSVELGAWLLATGASYLLLTTWERKRIFSQNGTCQ